MALKHTKTSTEVVCHLLDVSVDDKSLIGKNNSIYYCINLLNNKKWPLSHRLDTENKTVISGDLLSVASVYPLLLCKDKIIFSAWCVSSVYQQSNGEIFKPTQNARK